MKSLGLQFIPSRFAVKTAYQPSTLQIDVKQHKPVIDVEPHKPIHQYERGSVSIDMKNYQSLDIDFVHLFPDPV